MVKAMSLTKWFDNMLNEIKYLPDSPEGQLFPFFVRVGCIKRRPPRHEFFEYVINVGAELIDTILNHESIHGSSLSFVFPERHMGVAEQQKFMYVMKKHPEINKIKSVDIITSSPLLISNFMANQIRIITWPEDKGLYE